MDDSARTRADAPGALLLLLRKPAEAEELLERSFKRDRTDARTAGLLVESLLDLKRYGQIEKLLLAMSELPSQRPNLPRMLTVLCRESKDRELPLRFWNIIARRHGQDTDIAVSLARISLLLGWQPEALEILQSAAGSIPNNADLWRMLGRYYAAQGQYKELLAMMDKGLAADPKSIDAMADAMADIAAAAAKPGDERDFAELARRSKSPNQSSLLYLAGLFASAKNKQLLAADLYERATEKKPDFYRAYEALLQSYIAQKRSDLVDRLLDRMDTAAADTYLPHYLRGMVELDRGNIAKAIESLTKALKLKDDDLSTELLLARAYTAAGQTNDAIAVLIRALAANPDSDDAARNLFDIYVNNGSLSAARQLVLQLQQRNPDSIQTRLLQAELAARSGKQQEALTLLTQLSSLAPDNADVQILYVRTLLGPRPGIIAKRQFDDSARKLQRILQAQPANRKATTALGDLMMAVDDPNGAAAAYGAAFDVKPDDPGITRSYVAALADANEPAAALAAVEKYRSFESNEPDLWAKVVQIDLLTKLGRFGRAYALTTQWLNKTTDASQRRLFWQSLLFDLRDGKPHEAALKTLEEWIASHPAEPSADQMRDAHVHLLGLAGKYDKAMGIVDSISATQPLDLTAQRLALAAMDRKDYDKSVEILDKCLGTTRTFADTVALLKKAVADLKTAKAVTSKDYQEALAKLPDDLRNVLAPLVAKGQYDRAIGQVAEIIRQTDQVAWLSRQLKLVALEKAEKRDKSLALAKKWVAEMPDALDARKLLIAELVDTKKYDQAIKLLTAWKKDALFAEPQTQSAELAPEPDDARQWLSDMIPQVNVAAGRLDQALDQLDEQIDAYRQTVASYLREKGRSQQQAKEQTDSLFAKLPFGRGVVTKTDSELEQRIKLAIAALIRYPRSAELLALKSTVLGEMGKDDQAETVMRAAMAIRPVYAGYHNNLAYILAVAGKDLDKARSLSLFAVDKSRQDSVTGLSETAYVDTLGWVFYKQGNLVQAGRIFQRLIARLGSDEPGSGVIFDHAGDTYWRLGWRDKAVELWTKALELEQEVQSPAREDRELLKNVPRKIEAVRKGRAPDVAPLGKNAVPNDTDVIETARDRAVPMPAAFN